MSTTGHLGRVLPLEIVPTVLTGSRYRRAIFMLDAATARHDLLDQILATRIGCDVERWVSIPGSNPTSLLASSPAWRHVDPLPVLGRDDEEEEAVADDDTDEARNRRDEEHRAAWVLDDSKAAS